ncbi:MAG: vWA domain-containing protein [Spirochaetales bacterium]
MNVTSPELLAGLLVLVPLIALQVRAYMLGRRDVLILGSHLSPERLSSLFLAKWFLSAFLFDVFVIFSLLAASGVTWGETPVEEDRSGLEVAIAIDVSRSMLAADASPNRLEQSISVVRLLARELEFASFAIVTFKGDATVLMPMTSDINAVESVLHGVSPGLIATPGTDIASGLEVALGRFSPASLSHRAVVVISDGEALSGEIGPIVDETRRLGIPMFSVVVGTPEGAPVPAADGSAMMDEQGRPVISRADASLLRQVAEESGGALFFLQEPTAEDQLIEAVEAFADTREREGFRLVRRDRFRLFLGVALVALLLSLVIRLVKWRGMF